MYMSKVAQMHRNIHYNISYLIHNKLINADGTIPGFQISSSESKAIIQFILYILNHPVFQTNKQVFLSDAKYMKVTKKSGRIHPYESALYIVKENLTLF